MTSASKRKSRVSVVDGKRWVPSLLDWSWIATVAWMGVANLWKPFGLFGLVCFLTPIAIALSGRGKMHCARICPRGSLVQRIGRAVNLGLPRPEVYSRRGFRVAVWAAVMGAFVAVLAVFAPQGVDALGNAVLVFMEVMTVVAVLNGVLFKPRTWCTICPMGFTTLNLKNALRRGSGRGAGQQGAAVGPPDPLAQESQTLVEDVEEHVGGRHGHLRAARRAHVVERSEARVTPRG